ncbi:hypothetical protein Tco_0686771 [Tanacetum coccineum]
MGTPHHERKQHEETPFSFTYGMETVIPAEIGMPTLRTAELDLAKNDEALEINLDLIEEKREQAAIQEVKSKAKMENNDASHAKYGGKLGPKWEGPYEVTESLGNGAYKLKDQKGNELREHGTSVILKSVIYTKCKHPPDTYDAPEGTDHMRSWRGNKTKSNNAQDGGAQQHFPRLHLCPSKHNPTTREE